MAKVQLITQKIQAALRDINEDSWPEDVIYSTILDAERVVVNFRPDAALLDTEHTLVAGVRQSIAALTPKPNRLLNVKYNRVGSADGRSVRRVGIGDLDAISPDWRSKAGSTTIREFMHDEREPHIYYVNPPAAVGAKLQISYSTIPAEYGAVTSSTETTVSDLYEPMVFEWAMYRLFSHDVEGSVNIARAQQHLTNFQNMMGVKVAADLQSSPRNPEFRK